MDRAIVHGYAEGGHDSGLDIPLPLLPEPREN